MKKFLTYAGLVLTMLIWAFTFIWAKQVLNSGVSPTMLVFFRLTIVTLFIFPVFLITKQFKKILKKDLKLFLLMALFEPFLYFISEANGIKLVSPNIAAIIIATIPLFLPFFARIILKEKLSIINYLGIAVSFSGVLLIIFDKGGKVSASPLGLIYLFFAVFSAVGYTIIAKQMLSRYSPIFLSALKILIAWVYFIPVFLIFDLPKIQLVTFSEKTIILIAALGIGGNLIAYYFFNNSIKNIGASKSSIFSNLIPVFTVIFSFYILHEVMPVTKLGGIGLALCGIYISQIQFFKSQKSSLGND
jgi:drug/metabolite transporter (DMT)-like permease